jgi:hypothetical protein
MGVLINPLVNYWSKEFPFVFCIKKTLECVEGGGALILLIFVGVAVIMI